MEYHSGGSLPLLGRPRYCPGANANGGYLCETGHCCGESGCCTYYYELWWFWLLWTALILFSCCCAYRHRRAKLRLQQQQRQRDISLLAYQGASSFPSSMLDLSFLASLKLPSYEEVAAQPSTPPPPYSSVFTAPRYPQPPRAAHPHLLSQHPGAPQHPGARPLQSLQPLSDGPSSLSSDNSSSCSCDSCCPSSPCSSSLSAPVTYETDTSHASTPSEATPLALDPVTVETISAAAARLMPQDTVAILIERVDPVAAAAETKASPDLDVAFPVGITPPIKQQLDVTEASANLDRTLDNTSFTPPRMLSLILDSSGGIADTNPSLVPISAHHSPDPSSPSQGTTHFSTKPARESSELTVEAPDSTKQNEEARNVQKSQTTSQAPDDENRRGEHTIELSISIETNDKIDTTVPVNSSLSQMSESVATPLEATIPVQTSGELSEDSDSQSAANSTPEPIVLRLDAKTEPPAFAEARGLARGSVSISAPDPTNSERPVVLSPESVAIDEHGQSASRETETPALKPRPTTKADSLDVTSPTFDRETGKLSATNLGVEQNSLKSTPVDSKLLNLEKPSTDLTQDQTYPESPESVSISMPHPSVSKKSGSRENVTSQFPANPSAQPTTEADSSDLTSPTFDRETGKQSAANLDVETNSSKALLAESEVINSGQSLTKLNQDPTYLESPAFVESPELCATPPEPPRVSMSIPEPSLQFYAELPPSTPRPAAKASSLNVLSPTFDLETGKRSAANLEVETNSSKADSKVLNSEQSLTKLTQDPTYRESPACVELPELCTTPPEPPRVSMSIPEPSLQFYAELPPSTPRPAAKASSLNVLSPTFDLEMGKRSVANLAVETNSSKADSKVLNSEQSLTKLTQDPTYLESPAFAESRELCTTPPELPQLTERVSMSIPDARDRSLQFYAELPPQPTAKASSLNVLSPTFDLEMGKLNLEVEQCCSQSLLADSKLLNLDQSPDACLFFPAITIHADPPSFASPCSIPSPSQSPPASMLLLDPLAALQPSDRSASASSGHASSLSPSPRNTQSPPKQTLFSPCVDVFEPVVDPNWEDEESEGPADEEYCEDSDVAADESQYRHRRLTGDSGIEVCRCHVEDEDRDEDMEKKPDERKCASGAALHDSADCPVRSRGSSDDDAGLCNGETSPDEVVIPVETV